MGRSFICFKQHGFWTRDDVLLDWLGAALALIEKIDPPRAWQVEIAKSLENTIIVGFPGGIKPELDAFLTDDERIEFMIDLSTMIGYSPKKPKMKRLSELFIALIEGKLKTTVSSPIDYWSAS